MANILSSIGEVFTAAMGWVGDVATQIAGFTTGSNGEIVFNNPVLLLFCVAIPLVGLGVGMFRRLLHSRG